MVEHIDKIGALLTLPNLEPETIKVINERLRSMLLDTKPKEPPTIQGLTPTVMDEWVNGAKKEGD